jgi:hypothetical protein
MIFAQRSIFSAGAEKCKCPIEIGPDGALTVTGIILGAIRTMKLVSNIRYHGKRHFSPWARGWMPDDLADPNSVDKSYVTGGNAFEAYWRTLMTDCLVHPTRRLSQHDLKEYTEVFNEWGQKTSLFPSGDPELGQHDKDDWDEKLLVKVGIVAMRTGISSLIDIWQFAELDNGLYAMVPWEGFYGDYKSSKIGDLVVIVDGGKVPLVLRERNNIGRKWEVIGTGYTHGFMDGLASQWAGDGKLIKRNFDII